MKLPLPLRGVNDVLPDSEQPGETTRDMLNARGEDPRTRKIRLSSRAGIVKYLSGLVSGAAEPIRALRALTFPRKNIEYTDKVSSSTSPLDSTSIAHSTLTGSAMPVTNLDTDKQGNVYAIDGLAGVVKYNSNMELQWKQPLTVRQETAVVRALRVATMPLADADSEVVFAGQSTGGRQADALMWAYKQVSTRDAEGKVETKTELIWELETGAYTEVIRVRNSLLYAAQNEPDKGRAYVRIYFGLIEAAPTLAKEFRVPYPIYGLDVRADDGAIITCHPPNATRGIDPRCPGFTGEDLAREWTIDDLVDKDKRLWIDLNAQSLKDEGLADGDPITAWIDDGPSFRSLFALSAVASQPTLVWNGIGGEPAVRFSGKTAGTTNALFSQTNPAYQPQYRDQQKTIVPGTTNSKWAMFIVMRCNSDTDYPCDVFSQDNQSPAGANTNDLRLVANQGSRDEDPSVVTTLTAGKLLLDTTTVDATGEGMGLGAGGGLRSIPFAGDMISSKSTGAVLVTIIHDGRNNPGTDIAQHSTFRVSGRPLDRYISADHANIAASALGASLFGGTINYLQGDIARIIVLGDYTDGGVHGDPVSGNLATNATAHYPRVVGTFLSAATNFGCTSGNRYNDNEIERIEGWLAGIYGISHTLPTGTASILSASVIPNAGDTVTMDGLVYTFVTAAALAAAPTTARNVSTGPTPNCREAFWNLFRAVNATGTPGTDYGTATVEHPTCRATSINDAAAGTAHIKVETQGLVAVSVSESTAGARMTWSNATTAAQGTITTSAVLAMPGHYPHPFGVFYGFPRKDVGAAVGVTLESKGLLLNSHEGILARWDPQGKIVWVATSRLSVAQLGGFSLPASDQKFGAIGYDCAFGTDSIIYSAGPQYAAAAGDEGSVLRRIVDTPTGPTMTGNGTWTMGTTALAGAAVEYSIIDAHLRIAVDTFNNVYLPFYETVSTAVMSAVCVSTVKVAGVDTATVAWTWRVGSATTNPAGICIAVDKKLPNYDGDPATRAFRVYVGTRMGYTVDLLTQDNLYAIEPVAVRHIEGVGTDQTRLCAIVNGGLWTSLAGAAFLAPSGSATLTNPVVSTDVLNPDGYYSMASLNGHLLITDGRVYLDYNGRSDVVVAMRSKTAGELKLRARCVVAWRGRAIWYAFADDRTEYLMGAVGNIYDYDIAPPVQSAKQAVLGSLAPRGTGQAPDIINKLFAGSDDTLFFGCASSIHRLDGDPMDNGRFVLVTDETGIAFGDSVCKDENGVTYAFGTRGAVVRITGTTAKVISNEIPERLRSIDFSQTRPCLVWSSIFEGLHLFLSPVDPTDAAITEHYFWSRKFQGWYPDSINSVDMQPTCTFVGDGELASDRRVVFGCPDGYLRAFDQTATDDDGVAILSRALIGPLAPDDIPVEMQFKELRAVLATAQGGCGYRLFATDTPDDLGDPVASGSFDPGRNPTHFIQGVGSYVALEVSNSTHDGFSIESLDMDAFPAGQKVKR